MAGVVLRDSCAPYALTLQYRISLILVGVCEPLSQCACHKICASRFTKRCACHEISASRFTKRRTCREICTSRFTKRCTCHEICASRFTKRCACNEICTPRSTKLKYCACHEVCKRATWPKVTIHCTCHKSGRLEDHHPVERAAPPATKSPLRSKAAPICCACHQNTRFPLRLPRKVTTMSENGRGAATRAQSRQAPAAHARARKPAQSKCASRISRGMNAL